MQNEHFLLSQNGGRGSNCLGQNPKICRKKVNQQLNIKPTVHALLSINPQHPSFPHGAPVAWDFNGTAALGEHCKSQYSRLIHIKK